MHFGRAEERLAQRHAVLQEAYADHPERFPHGPPKRQVLPAATYINPPSLDRTERGRRVGIVDDLSSTHLMLAPEEAQ